MVWTSPSEEEAYEVSYRAPGRRALTCRPGGYLGLRDGRGGGAEHEAGEHRPADDRGVAGGGLDADGVEGDMDGDAAAALRLPVEALRQDRRQLRERRRRDGEHVRAEGAR